jgi:transcriptional regulator with XRE-family HTH domain
MEIVCMHSFMSGYRSLMFQSQLRCLVIDTHWPYTANYDTALELAKTTRTQAMSKARSWTARSKPFKANGGAGFGPGEMSALGREFRRLRESRAWSLKRTARESGISVAAIRNIEGGSANPSLLTVLRLAEVFGRPLDQLVAASREAVKVIKLVNGALPRSVEGLLDLTAMLTDRSMAAHLVSISPRGDVRDLPIKAPFFGYLLEGSLVLTFDDGHVERLQPQDAVHVSSRFPSRLTNPLARRSVLLCLADLRNQRSHDGGENQG